MALMLGREGAWINSPSEASQQYDRYELDAVRYFFREKPIPSQHGRSSTQENPPSPLIVANEESSLYHVEDTPKASDAETLFSAASSPRMHLAITANVEEVQGLSTTMVEVSKIRKRKKRRVGEYKPNEKEIAAAARHEEARSFILALYEAFRQQLFGISLPGVRAKPAKSEMTSPSKESGSKEDTLDLVSLGQGWQANLFEIAIQNSDGDCFPLFNTLNKNDRDSEVLASCMGHDFLLPKRSAFLLSDFSRLSLLIPETRSEGYDIILLDPPWENKSVRRQATYATLPNRNLLGLPLQKLAHSDGALVAIWVTNREKLRAFVVGELLDAWGLQLEATWHWLKVTSEGEMISPLDLAHHRPYEVLVLARAPPERRHEVSEEYCSAPVEHAPRSELQGGASEAQGEVSAGRSDPLQRPCVQRAPANFVLISVPGEHSRKPPLKGLLEKYSGKGTASRGIELFAREMTAGWTSWGNEVLRFQEAKYFTVKEEGAPTSNVGKSSSNHHRNID